MRRTNGVRGYGRATAVVTGLAAIIALLVYSERGRLPGVCLVGDTAAREQATVPTELAHVHLDARRIRFGLGAIAIGDWPSLGDGLVVAGRAWLRTTHHESPRYYALVSNRYFQTSALAYVPHGMHGQARIAISRHTSVASLWEDLARRYPAGVMVEGLVKMRSLHTIAIAEPAITGIALSANPAYYYTHPMESVADTWVYLAGIAAMRPGQSWVSRGQMLRRMLPPGTHAVAGYAHVLRLADAPRTGDDVAPGTALALGQVVGRSVIEYGEIELFPVRAAAACTDALISPAP